MASCPRSSSRQSSTEVTDSLASIVLVAVHIMVLDISDKAYICQLIFSYDFVVGVCNPRLCTSVRANLCFM